MRISCAQYGFSTIRVAQNKNEVEIKKASLATGVVEKGKASELSEAFQLPL